MTEVIEDPYEGVNWDNLADPNGTGNPPRWEGHIHERGPSPMDEMHGVIDYLADEGEDPEGHTVEEKYTLIVANANVRPTWWPWDDPPTGEARDPEELGVIAIPGHEIHVGTHTYTFFGTADEDDVDEYGGVPDKIQDSLDHDDPFDFDYEPIVGFPHALRYVDNDELDERDYERFRFNTERLVDQSEDVILSVFGRHFPEVRNELGLELWDRLLTDFTPEINPRLTSHDDALQNFETGDGLDRRFVSVLLSEGEFDPSDQEGSRASVRDAWSEGRVLAHNRDGWNPDNETPPQPPKVEEIETTENTITVESNADKTEWVSEGDVVGTGETVDVENADGYLRCQMFNSDESAATFTQAWTVTQ